MEVMIGALIFLLLLRVTFATARRGISLLLLLVCAIELVQMFIPGRVADLDDVCTGWSGIFAAWLLAVLLDARAERRRAAD